MKILKIRKPSDYSEWVGQTDSHDLICVVNFSAVSPVRHSLNSYDVYGLFLQGDEENMHLTYGTGKYDYSARTLICVAPGQIGGMEDNGELITLTGWAILFHPDLLQGTGLEKEIKNFTFFEYHVNEALHMTEEERAIMVGLFRQIEAELKFPHDNVQNRIIVGFVNLMLRYAQRFYNRQFASLTVQNNDSLARFEALLKDYFENEEQKKCGVPTVQYCAERLNMSASYLSDIVRKATGNTAGRYIKQYVIQLAKNRLVAGMNSSEVAYSLGFDYPQHFSRTFKMIAGETPKEYAERRAASKPFNPS